MMDDERFAPRRYLGVMVCSTFKDLKEHRAALMKAIEAQGFYPEAMEHDAARPDGTVVDSSLQKVRDAAAYIGVISHKYGQIPESADSNPDGFSLTELEFREARRLGRPILIFIMGDDHDVKPNAVERDPDKIRKLEAFRDEVKRESENSRLHRVYATFNSLGEFEVAAERSVAELRRFLDGQLKPAPSGRTDSTDDIPRPPALYAEPRYIGSHAFVGRAAELATLSGWAAAAEPNPILLFEAIGGAGKSMLTWEWTVSHASAARADWAGTFWYSFYEKGAVMADFCRRALAYMTGRPLSQFRGEAATRAERAAAAPAAGPAVAAGPGRPGACPGRLPAVRRRAGGRREGRPTPTRSPAVTRPPPSARWTTNCCTPWPGSLPPRS